MEVEEKKGGKEREGRGEEIEEKEDGQEGGKKEGRRGEDSREGDVEGRGKVRR